MVTAQYGSSRRFPLPSPSKTILVVDDQPSILNLLSGVLGKEGYTTLVASNGKAALRICEQHADTIHLLITDILMPGMNGLELVTGVVARRPQIQVLYMSDSGVVANAFGTDHDVPFLEKPFRIEVLSKTVGKLLTTDLPKSRVDLRKHPRIPIGWPISFSGQGIVGEGQVVDLSMGGCCVETEVDVINGADLELRIAPPDHGWPIKVKLARVKWAISRRLGCEFLGVPEEDRERLRRLAGTLLSRSST